MVAVTAIHLAWVPLIRPSLIGGSRASQPHRNSHIPMRANDQINSSRNIPEVHHFGGDGGFGRGCVDKSGVVGVLVFIRITNIMRNITPFFTGFRSVFVPVSTFISFA